MAIHRVLGAFAAVAMLGVVACEQDDMDDDFDMVPPAETPATTPAPGTMPEDTLMRDTLMRDTLIDTLPGTTP